MRRSIKSGFSASATALALILAACSGGEPAAPTAPSAPADSSASQPEVPAEPFYSSRDVIEMIVPFGEGGGSDVIARYLAANLQQHIPGGASIQVNNVTGGGGIIGANEFENLRAADGLTIMLSRGSTIVSQALGDPAVQYDIRNWVPIFSVPAGAVTFVRSDTGISGPADLGNYSGTLQYGGTDPSTAAYTLHLLAYDVLGLNYRSTWGYDGAGAQRVAFEQGELDFLWDSTGAYRAQVLPLVENGLAVPLFSIGQQDVDGNVVRDPAHPDLPHPGEVYELLYGQNPQQGNPELWEHFRSLLGTQYNASATLWVARDTPPEALRDLQAAVAAMNASPAFVETREDALGEYEPVVDPEILTTEAWVNSLLLAPETVEFLIGYLRDNYGIDLQG